MRGAYGFRFVRPIRVVKFFQKEHRDADEIDEAEANGGFSGAPIGKAIRGRLRHPLRPPDPRREVLSKRTPGRGRER